MRHRVAVILRIFAVVLLAVTATVIVLDKTTDVVPVEAGTYECVAGVLIGGTAFIATVIDPPAGIAAILGWGSTLAGFGLTAQGCQTNWLKNAINSWRERTCGVPTYFMYYAWQFRNFRWSQYAVYAGVGSGGGGGCSGNW